MSNLLSPFHKECDTTLELVMAQKRSSSLSLEVYKTYPDTAMANLIESVIVCLPVGYWIG